MVSPQESDKFISDSIGNGSNLSPGFYEPPNENIILKYFKKWTYIRRMKIPNLYKITEVPDYLRFNPFILNGYRDCNLTFWKSIYSLFYFHNETVNILSHGIPMIYFLILMPRHIPWSKIDHRILAYFHILGCVAPWLGSCVYHLFMNHQLGPIFYAQLLKWDVLGIWVTQSFGASTMVYTSFILYSEWLRYSFFIIYFILAVIVLKYTLSTISVWSRRLGFSILVLFRFIAFGFRMYSFPKGQGSPLIHTLMQEILPITGAIVSALRIPERWWPGKFDFAFNSHNLLHILVVLGALHMHWATCEDLIYLANLNKLNKCQKL